MSTPNDNRKVARVVAEVTFRPHSQGGRPMMPIGNGYAPYIRSARASEDLAVRVNNIPEGAQFGQRIMVTLELSYFAQLDYGALAEGVPFELIEGPKVVAEGVCKSKIITS